MLSRDAFDRTPCCLGAAPWLTLSRAAQQAAGFDEVDDCRQPVAGLHVAEDEWLRATHSRRITGHHFSEAPTIGARFDLVDDQEVRLGDAGPPCAGSCRGSDVDDIERQVGKFRAEGRGEVVAADSISTVSMSGKLRVSRATASRLIERPHGSRCAGSRPSRRR